MDSIDPDKMVPYELPHLDLSICKFNYFHFGVLVQRTLVIKTVFVTNDFAVKSNLLLHV